MAGRLWVGITIKACKHQAHHLSVLSQGCVPRDGLSLLHLFVAQHEGAVWFVGTKAPQETQACSPKGLQEGQVSRQNDLLCDLARVT